MDSLDKITRKLGSPYPIWIGLDPGTKQTGWCVFDPEGEIVLLAGHDDNERILEMLDLLRMKDAVVMESFAAQGMPLGESSLETVRWEGRFIERHRGKVNRITRREVKVELCNSARAKDANIRQALVDLYAHGFGNHGYGTKAEPSPLYCMKGSGSHGFSALAVCTAWLQKTLAWGQHPSSHT